MNKSLFVIILLVLAVVGLYSQEQTWQAKIIDINAYLETNPSDTAARTALAYYYMMNNQPLLGLREYRVVVEADSSKTDAQAGILWALNSMEQYKTTIKLAHDLLQTYPEIAAIHNLVAFAYLKKQDTTIARYHYKMASDEAGHDLLARQTALEGLGWTNMLLDNTARALQYYSKAQSLNRVDIYGLTRLNTPRFTTAFSYSVPDSTGKAYRVSQSIRYRTWKADLAVDEFQLNNKHFRTIYMANLTKQFSTLQTGLHYAYADGNDARVYPASNIGLSVAPMLYYRSTLMKLDQSVNMAHYERFNGYQYSITPSLRRGKWQTAYTYSYHYQDNEAVGADTSKAIHRVQLSRTMYKGSELGLYGGYGDTAWTVDNYLNLTDAFDAKSKYFGCSLFVPLGDMIELTQYNEWGYSADWQYLFYLKLAIRY
ncbi:MAG: hypothetical protein CVU48_08325 [Candidatus Cloacimonetes bacterium HGW-Cloacimonetes-1]|nr:MAG: hypothetical protein CVU48_08325 [Candidatus Cloacimonetes bacterium HGW-Cloacimonetes-1]